MAGQHRGRRLLDGPAVLPVTVAVLGLALLLAGQLLINRPSIEDDLTDTSTVALRTGGIAGARVSFDGRDADIVLVGGSAADAAKARSIVENVDGVRVATVGTLTARPAGGTPPPPSVVPPAPNETPTSPATPEVTEPVPSASPAMSGAPSATVAPSKPVAKGRLPIGLTFDEGVLTLTGSVPSEATRDAVVESVGVPGWTVADRLQIDAAVPKASPAWINSLAGLAKSVPTSGSRVVVRYDGSTAIVRGTPATSAIEFRILDAALATVSDRSQVLDGLDVPGT